MPTELTNCCGRMSAKSALQQKIVEKKAEAFALETIYQQVEWDMLTEDEEASLWAYMVKL